MVYGTSAVILLASADGWLAVPILCLVRGLWRAAAHLRADARADRSVEVSEARSIMTWRIVDTYTNILTLKLFARAREEDAYAQLGFEDAYRLVSCIAWKLNTIFSFCSAIIRN